MAKIAKKTKRYPSDLTAEKWAVIAPLMPNPGHRGRPREVEFREVISAVLYLVRSGCDWPMPPVHFGHWRTVYGWFRELTSADISDNAGAQIILDGVRKRWPWVKHLFADALRTV